MEQLSFPMEAPLQPKAPVEVRVRAKLANMLAELRQAHAMPWAAAELERWRVIAPQMCRRLPEAEAQEVMRELERELERLR